MIDLRIKDLHFKYPDGRMALDGVNLEVERGTRTALVGKNGAGKTTLLLHVVGLLDGPGEIEVCGIPMSPGSVHDIRKKAGYLFSHVEYQFIMPDLLSDVMLGCGSASASPDEKRRRAERWLERFGLERYHDRSPLDLSSGEMKRAALAGIMAGEAEILLLDEPLGNLDREGAGHLTEILAGLGRTMVFSTHRHFLVERVATHVAVMDRGRINDVLPVKRAMKSPAVRDLVY